MKHLKLILIALFFFAGQIFAQTIVYSKPTNKRTSDLLKYNAAAYPLGLSKFIQNLNINDYDDWTSMSSVIFINGVKYNTLPFNYTSPDFIPIELSQIDYTELNYDSDIINGTTIPSGGLNLITRPISDSLKFSLRAFTGSETGDPLIYRFTRENIPIVNKNKIVPSVVLTAEGKSTLNYRFTGGYFGYFAFNSSENSLVMSGLGNSLTKRQNRQLMGSAELEYVLSDKRKISLLSSFINFYGWELPPFLTTFVHLRNFNFANRITFHNIFDNTDVGIKYDGNISRIWELDLIPSGKIGISDISFFTKWTNRAGDNYDFTFNTEAGSSTFYNIDTGVPKYQKIFADAKNYIYYTLNPNFTYSFSDKFKVKSSNIIEKGILPAHKYSGSVKLSIDDNTYNVSLLFSTIASFPGIFEKYGRYSTLRPLNEFGSLDTFTISGNNSLVNERVNSISGEIKFAVPGFSIKINPFFRNVVNPVILDNREIKTSFYPKDIIRNAEFINIERKNSLGIFNSISSIYHFLNVTISHAGLYNNNLIPSNKFLALCQIDLNSSGSFLIEYIYASSKKYKDFEVIEESLFNSTLPEISIFTISYTYLLKEFYVFKDIYTSLRVDNIFNRRVKFHPLGNNMDRTIEFSFALEL